MPHISSEKLDEDIIHKIFSQLVRTLEKASDKRATKYLASELFTHTERIMLAKRLAAILLVDKGVPQHVVADQLHMSISTISKIALKIEMGKYRAIRNISGKRREDMLTAIEKMMLMGMPPRYGRGRWSKWGR